MTSPIPPTIGRIVLYQINETTVRPAIINGVRTDECVDLHVFAQARDGMHGAEVTDAPYHNGPGVGGTWRWIPGFKFKYHEDGSVAGPVHRPMPSPAATDSGSTPLIDTFKPASKPKRASKPKPTPKKRTKK